MTKKAKKRGGNNNGIYEQLSLFDLLCTDVTQSVSRTIEGEERSTVLRMEGSWEASTEVGQTRGNDNPSSQWTVEGYGNRESNRSTSLHGEADGRATDGRESQGNHAGLVVEATGNATSSLEQIRLEHPNSNTETIESEQTPIVFSFTQEEINLILQHSCQDKRYGRIILTTEFSKGKTIDELEEILKKIYCDGFGIQMNRNISAWFDKDKGMYLSESFYAKNHPQSMLISWHEMTEMVSQLLDDGQYATKIELLNAKMHELNSIAEKIIYLYRDILDGAEKERIFHILPQFITPGFPESTVNISSALNDEDLRKSIHDEIYNFNTEYQSNKELLRFHYHQISSILKSIEELELPRKVYHSSIFQLPVISYFITDDEINQILIKKNLSSHHNRGIPDFFKEEKNITSKANFLKNAYGTGGESGPNLVGISYDAKGITFSKTNCKTVKFTWLQIANRIDKLLDEIQYEMPKIEESNEDALNTGIDETDILIDNDGKIETLDIEVAPRLTLDTSFDTRLSVKEKIARNIHAIKLLSDLEFNGQQANEEQKKLLQQFSGWGGCPQLFNEKDDTYSAERTLLKEILSIDEYQNARSATLTSYYTPIEVIDYMYKIVDKLGFENGKILDTSTGTGHFFGAMPDSIFEQSDIYGVELDSVSFKIAHQLYPEVHLINSGFENCPFPNDQFDLAISNVPFGNYQVFDKQFSSYHFHIHNYFFAKALSKIRDGGLVAFITTTETMDGNSSIMEYINTHADFLGAIRLPNNTFMKNGANTEVSSDIIFLKKNNTKKIDYDANFTKHTMYSEHRKINQYFIDNPQMVFGHIVERKNQYGKYMLTVNPDEKPLQEHFSEVMNNFTAVYKPAVQQENTHDIYIPIDIEHSQIGKDSYFIENDTLFYREDFVYYKIQTENTLKDISISDEIIVFKTEKDIDKVKKMVKLAEATVSVVENQMKNIDENIYLEARNKLNQQYDDFVKEYGALHKRTNSSLFQNDSRLYLLNSLEEYNQKTKEIIKSPIFTERTINIKKEIKSVDTVHDGLMRSLDVKGGINVDYISTIYGKSITETREELLEKQYVFIDPGSEQLVLADVYLSGNIRKKLGTAKNYGYKRNIEALSKVMPEDIKAEDITIQLGATWVPEKYVKQFMSELFEFSQYQEKMTDIQYDHLVGTWILDTAYPSSVVRNVWGVAKSDNLRNRRQPDFDGYDLFDCVINSKSPTIRNYWEERNPENGEMITKSEVNVERTTQAQDLVQQLNERWEDWIFSDIERRDDLVKRYNELFNSTRLQAYDGSYLTFPEMNALFQLEPYQKNAVARIMDQNTNTLLWQKVGAGKTFEMIAAGKEMKRLGIRNKILYVVPNHLLNQWENEYLKLYPNAHLLVATKRDFAKERRQTFVNKIATGNYDAIIMPHSSFGMISVSTDKQIEFEQKELTMLKQAIISLNENSQNRNQTKRIKILERTAKSIENRIKSLTENKRDENIIPFEKLGIDFLFVDESHEFKNLFTYSAMQNVVGLQTASSKKAQDMFIKTRIIQNNGGRICFATGTPVTNTMAELYTLQRYLQLEQLHEMNIYCFDAWAKAFGKVVSSFEISIDGTQFVNRQRFAKFFNVQELMTSVRSFAEIQTEKMLRQELLKSTTRSKSSVPPTHIGGKPQIVRIEPSEALENYISSVVDRSEKVHNRQVTPEEDNMLKITSDSKKASIDLRLIDPSYPDEENGKLSVIAKKVYEIYQDGMEEKATQLIFCDSSTPKKNVPVNQFSDVYNEIKRKLIILGIPETQIAFIHDYDTELKKERLFKQMNDGEMRVLFGSTAKLGAGTNVQKRLLAVHHVDVPWKASDIEQQNGRAFRQGNMFKEIYEFRYVTEKSFDAYSWQIVQTKSTYDEQLLEGADGLREFEESQKSSFEYAEIKAIASGNPIIKEKFEIDNEVRRLQRLKKQWRRTKMNAQDQLVKLPTHIQMVKNIVDTLYKEWDFLKNRIYTEEHIEQNFLFNSASGHQYRSMKEAWEDVTNQMKSPTFVNKKVVGQFLDCNILIEKSDTYYLKIESPTKRMLSVDTYNPVGRVNFVRILKRLLSIKEHLNEKTIELDMSKKNLETAKSTVQSDFIHDDILRNARKRQKEINQILNGEAKDNHDVTKETTNDYEREEFY